MAFNGMCTGNDMLLASERGLIPESKLKLKAPKPSYIITTNITKDSNDVLPVDFKPTKDIYFNLDLLPNWLDLSFYSIRNKNGKRINAVHIMNKCLMSKNPYIYESSAILYCHENETDLLRIIPLLIDISIQMKCDIISFDYLGFGDSNTKPKNTSIYQDAEDIINFAINHLKYKIENLILFGKGIGSMSAIYLASMNDYHNCKSLILCMPIVTLTKIDVKTMRNISCKSLIIKEIDNKEEIEDDDIILLCREIPNEKEWLPIKKKKVEMSNKFQKMKNFLDYPDDDVYTRHRSKFILKLRDYVYSEDENMKKRIKLTGSIEESTDSETNLSLGHFDKMENKPINFDEGNEIKNEDKSDDKKLDIFNQTVVQIHNDDDY